MPSIENNRLWNSYGDNTQHWEWDDQARFCNQPYEAWKEALAKWFMQPNIHSASDILEIGPGHGRWTKILLEHKPRTLAIIDLNPEPVAYCKSLFPGVSAHVGDGRTLPFPQGCFDFIWSYDAFVHFEEDVTDSYLRDIAKCLKTGGTAVIHHSGATDRADSSRGWRGAMTAARIQELAHRHNLLVTDQTQTWGHQGEFNCRLHGDYITTLVK